MSPRLGQFEFGRGGGDRGRLLGEPTDLIRESLATSIELAEFARDLAKQHLIEEVYGSAPTLRRATRHLAARLALNHAALIRVARSGSELTPDAKWLFDNLHLSERIVPELVAGFSSHLERRLPRTRLGTSLSLPLVHAIAERYVAHTDSHFSVAGFAQFLTTYQVIRPLKLRELSIVPLCLKLVYLENMTRATARVVLRHEARQQANAFTHEMLDQGDQRSAIGLLVARLGSTSSDFVLLPFVVQLLRRLREEGARAETLVEAIGDRLALCGLTCADALTTLHDDQIATTATIANMVGSLRALDLVNWSEFFEAASAVDAVLGRCANFRGLSSSTRALYRHAVEELSDHAIRSEIAVARTALDLSAAARGDHSDAETDDVGFFLVGDGRSALEHAIGFRAPADLTLRRLFLRAATFNYLIPIILLSWVIVVRPLADERLAGASFWAISLIAVLGLVGASELAVTLVNRLITEAIGPRRLPRLDLSAGIPNELRTMVAVPALLTSAAQIGELLTRLEVHYLSNADDALTFAVLSDFADADVEGRSEDDALIAHAQACVETLNCRHPRRHHPRFFLFHRRRQWNPTQGVWMGWERKRGKLHELNLLLRGGPDTSFSVKFPPAERLPPHAKFVVTLDSDTQIPPNAVRELVATLAHPLNRPIFDPILKRVVRGHGLLQPRITPTLAPTAAATPLQRLESMSGGLDPYAFSVSDLYQDLFGEGSYVGKGIYDIDAFEAALAGRVPENAVLSHDLLEGLFVRAGVVSDIEFFEEAPANYLVARGRQHRWIRGDWQLLPWIFGRSAVDDAHVRTTPLPLLGWWKLLDNLRRSLVAPAIVACLLAIWTLPLVNPIALSLLIITCLVGPALLPVVFELGLSLTTSRARGLWTRLSRANRFAGSHAALCVVMLAHHAWSSADAIVRTLYRLHVTRRHLLEWTTAARLEASASRRLRDFYANMVGSVVIATAACGSMLIVGSKALPVALPIVASWFLAPAIAWWISTPRRPEHHRVASPSDVEILRDIAQDTWRFFERFVGAEDNFLPPDNYQEDPEPLVAHRTSPTNIGLYLLSILAARDFGWITIGEMVERLEATLATVHRLDKHRGHLFNWYDTRTLASLMPRYVSSVDSGNLAAYLIVLRQGCLAAIEGDGATPPAVLCRRLADIANAADALARAMDFSFLVDAKRKLLCIGYRFDDASLDAGCYDLLASEARLATFLAIVRGDAPVASWFRLGRSLTMVNGTTPLLSWSGSMFEYLMPSLVMSVAGGSALDDTQDLVVAQHIAHGKRHGVPWGVSESAYSARDFAEVYQYRAFGLPGLALKPGLEHDLVIAPYATGLAAMVSPAAAAENFAALARAGGRGVYGFYEALDYTAARLPKGRSVEIIRAYMAHHQGMILVALANAILGNRFVRLFHSDPRVRAFELLLQERATLGAVAAARSQIDDLTPDPIRELALPIVREFKAARYSCPVTQLLSNGRYCVMLTTAGEGYSRWRDVALTRWREDTAVTHSGVRLVIRDRDSGAEWSAGARPRDPCPDQYQVTFSEDHAEIIRHDGQLVTRLSVVVSGEDDVEVRALTLTNAADRERRFEVTASGTLSLIGHVDDDTHSELDELFLAIEYDADLRTLLASRRARSGEEPRFWLAAVMVVENDPDAAIDFDPERASLVGHGFDPLDPVGISQSVATAKHGMMGDAVFALRTRLTIAPGATKRIIFAMIVAATRDEALRLAAKYCEPAMVERASTLAWTRARIRLDHLGIEPDDANLFQQLASVVIQSTARHRRADSDVSRVAREPLSSLRALGISGNLPIVLVHARDAGDLAFVQQMMRCHVYWREMLVDVDLVCINEGAASDLEDFQGRLEAMARRSTTLTMDVDAGLRGKLVVLCKDRLAAVAREQLDAVAEADFSAGSDGLAARLPALRAMSRVDADSSR